MFPEGENGRKGDTNFLLWLVFGAATLLMVIAIRQLPKPEEPTTVETESVELPEDPVPT
jgi:hypothetical protein